MDSFLGSKIARIGAEVNRALRALKVSLYSYINLNSVSFFVSAKSSTTIAKNP